MVAYSSSPKPDHAVKRDKDGEEVGEKEHWLGADAKIALDIPVAER